MTHSNESSDTQVHDDRNINHDFDLTPPAWFENLAPPIDDAALPVNVIDDATFEAEWLDALSDDGSAPAYYSTEQVEITGNTALIGILWQGRQWAVTVRGVVRRDGSHLIPIDKLWSTEAIRAAVATVLLDADDLKEALRIGRRLDCYFDVIEGA